MGLDVGERRIGVALSDPGGVLASPLTFIERVSPDADVQRVLALAHEHNVGRIVVGLPLTLRGQRGPQARAADAFRRALTTVSDIQVMAWDERLSTVEAERRLREAGTRPSMERGRTDAASAAIILQSYLDSRKARS
jgi:putative Holliday junction resolvase